MTITLTQIHGLQTPAAAKVLVQQFMQSCEPRSEEYLEGIFDAFIREAKKTRGAQDVTLRSADKYQPRTAQRDAYYAGVEAGQNHIEFLRSTEKLREIQRAS